MNSENRKLLENNSKVRKVTLVGMVVNTILSIVKIIIGFVGFSSAMVADGIHSFSDTLTDIVVLIGIKFSKQPADKDHNYGHEKYETIAITIISFFLIIVGIEIIRNGISKITDLYNGIEFESPKMIALYASVASILVKELLFQYTIKYSNKLESRLLRANAWHHRSDAFSSIGAFIGIGGAILLGDKWIILDPIASIIVALFIFKVAYNIIKPAINELTEKAIPDELRDKIKSIIESQEGIEGYHHLHTRTMGNKIIIEMHIFVDKEMSVLEAHNVASILEEKIRDNLNTKILFTTHIEPYNEKRANSFKNW